MTLPTAIHEAIDALAAKSIRPSRVVPLWFRVYLALQPLTPPPHFGASPGAWRFLVLFNMLALWMAALAIGGDARLRCGAPQQCVNERHAPCRCECKPARAVCGALS